MAQTFGIKIQTRLSYDELDSILAQYCRGAYRIHLGGLDTTLKVPRKTMVILCEDADDRARIKAIFAMRGAVKQPVPEKTADARATEKAPEKTAA